MATSIPQTNINDLNYYSQLQGEIEGVARSLDNLISQQRVSGIEAANIRNSYRNLSKEFKGLNSLADRYNSGQLKTKDIQKDITKLTSSQRILDIQIQKAGGNAALKQKLMYARQISLRLNGELNALEAANKLVDKRLGLTGKLFEATRKIPIIGDLLDLEEATQNMRILASETDATGKAVHNKFKIVGEGIKTAFEGISGELKGLLSLKFFFSQALKANTQIVELGKALGKSSYDYRQNLTSAARSSSNLNVTTENLVGAFNEISQSTGYTYEYTTDQLETQIKLTKQVGLQADEAAQIQRYSVLNNQTSEKTYNSFIKGLVSARNQLRVGIDFKATLAEAVKVSGQLAANLGYNPERISKAIVTAKAFGMTLEQVAKSGETLLNWESSIDNELKAELLTGKQLNLEKARYAALTGDQITLAEELANQVGTAADFTKMNVLQQKALAESVGMTADELSNTLRKREEAIKSGKSLVQITEEEATKALERQDIQEKFNAAVLKLQDIIGNLVAGPLGELLDALSSILNIVGLIGKPFSFIGYIIDQLTGSSKGFASVLKGILFTTIAIMTFMNPLKSLLALAATGGIIAGAEALTNKKYVGDGVIGPNGKILYTGTEGAIKLNDNDTVIAGTNLGGGGNTSMPSVDLTPMIAAINEVRASVDRLYNKNTTINMDSKQVGSTLVQSSYKLA
jgi:hypothetical protein